MPSGQISKDRVENRPPGINRVTIIILVAVFMVSAAGVYLFVINGNNASAASNNSKVKMQRFNLEDIVVNLADPGLRRYLRTSITLEYSQANLTNELADNTYRIRDRLIQVLCSKKTEDLLDKEALKQELLKAVNKQLDSGQVENIYFEEFLVQ